MTTLRIDIWSDVACPWCYVGKRRFEAALARFAGRDLVEVVWRAFELDPSAPRIRDKTTSYAARLARKYGVPLARGEAMIHHMTEIAKAEGLDFDFGRVQSGNTFDAHRLLQLALVHGRQNALKERLFRAYFCEGAAIGEPETLMRLAADVDLDRDRVSATLAGDDYALEVRADEDEARALGINGVPFFVLGGRYAVPGAQPVEVLLQALDRASLAAGPSVDLEGSSVCRSDDCVEHD